MSNRTVTLGDATVVVERPSALKASRAFAILKGVGGHTRTITKEWTKFVAEHEAENYVELTRTQARLRFPPRPILNPTTMMPARDEAGEVVYTPSVVEHMTDEDWAKSGEVLRLPESPTTPQIIAAVFPTAIELAEDQVYRLLALFTVPNDVLKQAWKGQGIDQVIDEAVDRLLGGYFDELLELAVVCGEVVDENFTRKIEELGDRAGKALRLIGIKGPATTPAEPSTSSPSSEPTSTPSDSRPTSSTDGPASSDGASTTPSAPRSTSSADSPIASSENAPAPEETRS